MKSIASGRLFWRITSASGVKFHKDNYTVVFEEDLREHIINFTILHPLKKIIKIYFRECLYADKILQINDLLFELKQLSSRFGTLKGTLYLDDYNGDESSIIFKREK